MSNVNNPTIEKVVLRLLSMSPETLAKTYDVIMQMPTYEEEKNVKHLSSEQRDKLFSDIMTDYKDDLAALAK